MDYFLIRLGEVAKRHYEWLSSIGMVCNESKTEFVIFDRHGRFKEKSLQINNELIKPGRTMKILGMLFESNLGWTKQVNKVIQSANAMILALRYINRFLTRPQFKMAVQAHYVSRITYGSVVWSRLISARDRQKLNVNLNRVARMVLKVNKKKLSNRELYVGSGLRSFSSVCIMAECGTLYGLCTELQLEPLSERLLSQSYVSERFGNTLKFFDYSRIRVGKNSFVNRAKNIAELMNFDWTNMKPLSFKNALKAAVPLYMEQDTRFFS